MRVISFLNGLLGATFCCAIAAAQTTPATVAPPAPSDAPTSARSPDSAWDIESLNFRVLIDGYYSYNANQPASAANGQINDLYNFNDKTDQFNLAMAELTINHNPNPIGVHANFIFGRASAIIHPSTDNHIEQAYISVIPPKWHGSEIDLGQFVTSAGAEVIEANNDWNYSRSLLFSWAIPYYHFGLRTSTPITKTWTAGLQMVNGWNTIEHNNGGVTIGLTSLYTKPKYNWALNYYGGPQNDNAQKKHRGLIDTTISLTPMPRFRAYLNYDYGRNRIDASNTAPADSAHWQGFAIAGDYEVSHRSSFAVRGEYFDDNQGFATGTAQTIKEVTGTYQYTWSPGLLSRLEVRHDWSNDPVFHKGYSEMVGGQTTVTTALIAYFGAKL